jgi:hypothetical protein
VAAVCFLVTGCGSSDRQQVRAKVEQFAIAVAHKDAKTICTNVFAPSLVRRFRAAGLSCEHGLQIFFSGIQNPTLSVGQITVHGSRASAVTLSGASGQTASLRPLELVKTSNGWRIAAVGAPVQSSGGSGAHGTGTTSTSQPNTSQSTTKPPPKTTATSPQKTGRTSTKP